MVFGISGNLYNPSNPRKPLQLKKKKKKEKDQLPLFSSEEILLAMEESSDKKEVELNYSYPLNLQAPDKKQTLADTIISQIKDTKQTEELSKSIDSLVQSLTENSDTQKINDIVSLIMSATKKPKPFSIQKSLIYGIVKLLQFKTDSEIKKKCFISIINLIEQNNVAIRTLRHEKRPELNYILIYQKFVLENLQLHISAFSKNPFLLKNMIRLLKNSIYTGEENIKKQCVQLLNSLISDTIKNASIKSLDTSFILTSLEEVKYQLSGHPTLHEKIANDIRILSEKLKT